MKIMAFLFGVDFSICQGKLLFADWVTRATLNFVPFGLYFDVSYLKWEPIKTGIETVAEGRDGSEVIVRNRFTEKTVVITGASSGIGAAAARQFVAEGARVVLAARGKRALQEVADAIDGMHRVMVVPTDVTDIESVTALLEQAEQRFEAIHVLVNNAGYNVRGPVETKQVSELTRVVDVNLKAPVTLSRLVLPYLRRAGGGAIVNVASLAGLIPLADEAAYSATKFGLRAFTFALAEELKGSGITVSAVSPGPVDTSFIMADIDRVPDMVFSQPMSSAEEIATLILDCAHDGQRERIIPRLSGHLATLGYLIPQIPRFMRPFLERQGRLLKQRYRTRGKS